MSVPLHDAALALRAGIRAATASLVGREQLAELMVLAAVAQEHLLVVGPPGTAKSAVVRRVAQSLGGRYFEYLLGRFTEPAELFGPVDLRKLREGTVETDVSGMLPEAEIAFLDEVFLGSTAILNTLLGVLNERRFRRGHTNLQCPLRICVAAANGLPEDEALAAFADRFLLHLFVDAVPDHQLEAMLAGGWQAEQQAVGHCAEIAHLDVLCTAAREVDMSAVRGPLANIIRKLRQAGLSLSDRRIVKSQRLIAAAAVLAGRTVASEADLWPVLYVLPTREAQTSAQETLRDILGMAANPNLHFAVESVVLQPLSRVARLSAAVDGCLADGNDVSAFRPRAEALLREIDANFNAETLPDELAGQRIRLMARLTVSA